MPVQSTAVDEKTWLGYRVEVQFQHIRLSRPFLNGLHILHINTVMLEQDRVLLILVPQCWKHTIV